VLLGPSTAFANDELKASVIEYIICFSVKDILLAILFSFIEKEYIFLRLASNIR
jgi:hypothetical protein